MNEKRRRRQKEKEKEEDFITFMMIQSHSERTKDEKEAFYTSASTYICMYRRWKSHAYFNAFIFISFIILQYTIMYETTTFIFKAILYTFCYTSTPTGFTFFRDVSRSKVFLLKARGEMRQRMLFSDIFVVVAVVVTKVWNTLTSGPIYTFDASGMHHSLVSRSTV